MAVVDILLRVKDAASPALKSADNAAGKLLSTVDSVDKRMVDAKNSVSKWVSEQRATFDKLKANFSDTAKQYPSLQRAVSGLSGGLGTVANGAAGAAVGLAGVAAAGLALGAVFAAAGVGAVAGLGAVVVMAKEAQGRLAELSGVNEIQIAVSPASQAAIDNVSTSIESMKAIFDALVVTIAADVAPTISYVANVIIGFALAGLKAFKSFAEGGGSVLGELAYWLANGFIRALLGPINAVQLLLKAMILLGDAVGVPVGALKAADEGIGGMIDTAAKYVARQAEAVFVTSSLKKALDEAAASGAAFNATIGKAVAQRDAKPVPTANAEKVKAPTQSEIDQKNYVEVSNWIDAFEAQVKSLNEWLSGPDFAGAYAIQFEEMAKAAEESAKKANKELRSIRMEARAEVATNVINKASSPTSMLSATPVGAAISMVSAVGKGGGPIAEINTMLTDFTAGLQAFPDAITSGIEVLVKQVIPGLVEALPGAIRGIIGAVGAAIPEVISSIMGMVLDPKFWIDIIKALVTGIADGIKGMFTGGKERREERRAMRREDRGYASGLDYVGKTGMAVIHEGEEIVRRGGSMSLASKKRVGGGTVINVNIAGNLLDVAGLMATIRDAQRMGDTL